MVGGSARAHLELPPTASSVSAARRFCEEAVSSWGLAALADDLALVVSELVTNAILHAQTPMRVTLERVPGGLRVEVVDGSPAAIVPHVVLPVATGAGILSTDDGLEAAAGPAGLHPVRLAAVPVRLVLESDLNLQSVVREFQVMGPAGVEGVAGLVAVATEIVERFGPMRQSTMEAVREAIERGDRLVDVGLMAPRQGVAELRHLLAVLEEVAAFCERGDLLVLAPSAEVRRFRDWCVDELERQIGGRAPEPCPFTVVAPAGAAAGVLAGDGPAGLPEPARLVLHRLSSALTAARDRRSAFAAVLAECVGALGAHHASISLRVPGTDEVEIADSIGMPADVSDHWRRSSILADLPSSEAIRTGRIVVLRTLLERDVLYPALLNAPLLQDHSFACIPIPGPEGGAIGSCNVSFARSDELGPAGLALLQGMGNVLGWGLARLYPDGGRGWTALAEAAIEAASGRSALADRLVAAAGELSAGFDEWCTAFERGPDGYPSHVCALHPDQAKADQLAGIQKRWPPREASGAVVRCMTSRETVVFQVVPEGLLQNVALDDKHLAALRDLDMGALAASPVRDGGRVAGVLALCRSAGRYLTDAEVRLVERVARGISRV